MSTSKHSSFSVLAASEWLLILPAITFLAATSLRLLQPSQYEPARTSWIIFQWATTHISHVGAAVLFIALPGVVAGVGCVALIHQWQKAEVFRKDVGMMLSIVRR